VDIDAHKRQIVVLDGVFGEYSRPSTLLLPSVRVLSALHPRQRDECHDEEGDSAIAAAIKGVLTSPFEFEHTVVRLGWEALKARNVRQTTAL
jgi:hypothetical protein